VTWVSPSMPSIRYPSCAADTATAPSAGVAR
jgi:hypothetical protein